MQRLTVVKSESVFRPDCHEILARFNDPSLVWTRVECFIKESLMKGVVSLVLIVLSAACSAKPTQPVEPRGELGPLLSAEEVKGLNAKEFRTAINEARRIKGRRVLVVFDDVNGAQCPVEVRTIHTVCRTDEFGTIDPGVICRHAFNGRPDANGRDRIIWKSEDGTRFRITFDNQSPCADPTPTRFRKRVECDLKAANDLGVEDGKAGYFKYNIISEQTTAANPGCDLDPHFIVRR